METNNPGSADQKSLIGDDSDIAFTKVGIEELLNFKPVQSYSQAGKRFDKGLNYDEANIEESSKSHFDQNSEDEETIQTSLYPKAEPSIEEAEFEEDLSETLTKDSTLKNISVSNVHSKADDSVQKIIEEGNQTERLVFGALNLSNNAASKYQGLFIYLIFHVNLQKQLAMKTTRLSSKRKTMKQHS